MEPTEQLTVILPAISDLVDRVEPAQLHHATPCTDFDLSAGLGHMVGVGGSFSYLFRGMEPPTPAPGAPGGPGGADGHVPAATFRNVMHDLLAAVHSDGALERTIPTPLGP